MTPQEKLTRLVEIAHKVGGDDDADEERTEERALVAELAGLLEERERLVSEALAALEAEDHMRDHRNAMQEERNAAREEAAEFAAEAYGENWALWETAARCTPWLKQTRQWKAVCERHPHLKEPDAPDPG